MIFIYSKMNHWLIYAGILLFSLIALSWAKPAGYFEHDTHYWLEYPGTSTSLDELNPQWFDMVANMRSKQKILLRPDGEKFFSYRDQRQPDQWGESREELWTGTHIKYFVKLDRDGQVAQRTLYFPGWQAWVDGQRVEINYQDLEFPGRIFIPISAGEHQIEVKFTNQVWDRRLGDVLSVLGMLGFALMILAEVTGFEPAKP